MLLRQILDDAVGRGLLATNPARQALPPRHRRDQHRRRMAWTAGELVTFLTATARHVHHRTFWLAAYTGLRRSELAGLRWRDIDLDHSRLSVTRTIVAVNGHPTVSNGKTNNAARTIDLAPSTVRLLHRWRQDHIGEFGTHDPERGLIVRPDGELVNPQTLSQCCDRAVVAKTALPRISLHGLRHTHATLLLQAGVPLKKVVSERLGHSTPAFTMATYQHVLPGMQAQAAATFAALLTHDVDRDVQEVDDDEAA